MLLIFSSLIHAQTLTFENNAPQLGDSFVIHKSVVFVDQGPSGEGVIWDLTSLESAETTTHIMVDPSTQANSSFFDGTSLVGVHGQNQDFIKASEAGMERIGTIDPEYEYSLNLSENPAILMAYPFSYGSTVTDSFSGVVNSQGTVYNQIGNITITADGTGTIQMPYGDVENVLRVKVVEEITNFLDSGEITVVGTVYSWFKEGTHASIASILQVEMDGAIMKAVYYLDNNVVATKCPLIGDRKLQIAPNPAIDLVDVSFFLEQSKNVNWKLMTMNGQVILHGKKGDLAQGYHQFTMDLSGYPVGIYIFQLNVGDKQSTQLLQKI